MDMRIRTLQEKIDSWYEEYKDGKITLEERERRIDRAKEDEYLKVVLERYDVPKNATPWQRFDIAKKYLYQECADGRITIDEREHLIELLREDVFPNN